MRSAVVQDTDGSVEFSKVKLTPAAWYVQSNHSQADTLFLYISGLFLRRTKQ